MTSFLFLRQRAVGCTLAIRWLSSIGRGNVRLLYVAKMQDEI